MMVSVVIPTYNSERTLEKCLKSIVDQTYGNIEIIVVDKFSEDKTVEIAKSYGARIIQDYGERARAKNIGLKCVKGKYVLFVDSDMELSKDVARECVELVEKDDKIGGIIIPERSVGNGFWVRVRDFERSFYAGSEIESARFFRRDLAFNVALDTDCRTIDSYFIALQELTNSFLVSNDKIQVNNAKKFGSK